MTTPDNLTWLIVGGGLGALQLLTAFLAKNTLAAITSSINELRMDDKAMSLRMEHQHEKITAQISAVKVDIARDYVTRAEIAQANKDLRQDMQELRTEIVAEIRVLRNDIKAKKAPIE